MLKEHFKYTKKPHGIEGRRHSSCKISFLEVTAIFYLVSIVFVVNHVGQISLLSVGVWMQQNISNINKSTRFAIFFLNTFSFIPPVESWLRVCLICKFWRKRKTADITAGMISDKNFLSVNDHITRCQQSEKALVKAKMDFDNLRQKHFNRILHFIPLGERRKTRQ